jgi:hypothetical protein
MSNQNGVILVAFVKQYLNHKQIPEDKLSDIITSAWGKLSDIFTGAWDKLSDILTGSGKNIRFYKMKKFYLYVKPNKNLLHCGFSPVMYRFLWISALAFNSNS